MSTSATRLLTKLEAAQRLRISLRSFCKLVEQGRGPSLTRIGGRVFVAEADLEHFVRAAASAAPLRKAA